LHRLIGVATKAYRHLAGTPVDHDTIVRVAQHLAKLIAEPPMPAPRPGLVIRYDCLWTREAATGLDQGKERPPCLVAARDPTTSPRFVVILPITPTRPDNATVGVEIPAKVREALGLGDAPSWVIVSEHNVDEWRPGSVAGSARCLQLRLHPTRPFRSGESSISRAQ